MILTANEVFIISGLFFAIVGVLGLWLAFSGPSRASKIKQVANRSGSSE